MSKRSYHEEFKIEAAKQITEPGYEVPHVLARLRQPRHLYQWSKAKQISP